MYWLYAIECNLVCLEEGRLINVGFIRAVRGYETFHWDGVVYLTLCHIMLFSLFGRRGGLGMWGLLGLC